MNIIRGRITMNTRRELLVAILLLLTLSISAAALGEASLSFPALVETDCAWDDAGNLVSETAHDLNGQPALNARGFYRAEYTLDEHGNRLTAAYFGLNGEPVNIDDGFAKAEYTYFVDSKGVSQLLTEDRYTADGSRADIPHNCRFIYACCSAARRRPASWIKAWL